MNRLQDLENLKLIRLHKQHQTDKANLNCKSTYKGAMTQQTIFGVDKQLKDLRSE